MIYQVKGVGALILAALGAPAQQQVDEQGREIADLKSALGSLSAGQRTQAEQLAALKELASSEGASLEELKSRIGDLTASADNMATELDGIATALPRAAAVVEPVEEDHPDLVPQGPAETGEAPAGADDTKQAEEPAPQE